MVKEAAREQRLAGNRLRQWESRGVSPVLMIPCVTPFLVRVGSRELCRWFRFRVNCVFISPCGMWVSDGSKALSEEREKKERKKEKKQPAFSSFLLVFSLPLVALKTWRCFTQDIENSPLAFTTARINCTEE